MAGLYVRQGSSLTITIRKISFSEHMFIFIHEIQKNPLFREKFVIFVCNNLQKSLHNCTFSYADSDLHN